MAASDPEYVERLRAGGAGRGRSSLDDPPGPTARRADGIHDARTGRAPQSSDPDYLVGHGLGTGLSRTNGTEPASMDLAPAGGASVSGDAVTVTAGLARVMAGVMEPACRKAADAREANMLQVQILKRTEEAVTRLLPYLLSAGLDVERLHDAFGKGVAAWETPG